MSGGIEGARSRDDEEQGRKLESRANACAGVVSVRGVRGAVRRGTRARDANAPISVNAAVPCPACCCFLLADGFRVLLEAIKAIRRCKEGRAAAVRLPFALHCRCDNPGGVHPIHGRTPLSLPDWAAFLRSANLELRVQPFQ